MSDQPRREETSHTAKTQPKVTDAIRHVGPTLEQDDRFLAVEQNKLPENVIQDEGLTETPNIRAATADRYDREAEAIGAESLRTRHPGDTSSEPHTDVGPDNARTVDTDRNEAA